ncbi:MAG: hypothetical protein ACRDZ2_02990, partial [Ilumatobacteraceae bacterium]
MRSVSTAAKAMAGDFEGIGRVTLGDGRRGVTKGGRQELGEELSRDRRAGELVEQPDERAVLVAVGADEDWHVGDPPGPHGD